MQARAATSDDFTCNYSASQMCPISGKSYSDSTSHEVICGLFFRLEWDTSTQRGAPEALISSIDAASSSVEEAISMPRTQATSVDIDNYPSNIPF